MSIVTRIPLLLLVSFLFALPSISLDVPHSTISIPLSKIGDAFERQHARHVWQQRRNAQAPAFLQLQKELRKNEIQLHDQVLASQKLATYYGEISVGSNPVSTFRVLFDTGSCEFWVPDESCVSTQCARHRKYHRSSSFEQRYDENGNPSLLDVEYLSGKLQGYDGFETVSLGRGVVVPHQTVGFATMMDIPILKDLVWDGIVGLGFKNREIQERGVTPILDHIMEKGILKQKNLANQFSYFLSKEGGTVTFGGADLRMKRSPQEEFMWAPVNPDNSYWTVQLLGIRKKPSSTSRNSKSSFVLAPNPAESYDSVYNKSRDSIVDTGTYLIYAPKDDFDRLFGDNQFVSCSEKKTLPDLFFSLKGNTDKKSKVDYIVELALTPNDYVLEFEEDGEKECILGIAPDEETDTIGGWTFGQVFLRSYYTVFDRDHMQIGFVRSNSAPRLDTSSTPRQLNASRHKYLNNGPI